MEDLLAFCQQHVFVSSSPEKTSFRFWDAKIIDFHFIVHFHLKSKMFIENRRFSLKINDFRGRQLVGDSQ